MSRAAKFGGAKGGKGRGIAPEIEARWRSMTPKERFGGERVRRLHVANRWEKARAPALAKAKGEPPCGQRAFPEKSC